METTTGESVTEFLEDDEDAIVEDAPTLPLSRAYPSRYGAPILDRVNPLIFSLTYFAHCMQCGFCNDSCCQFGADIEIPRVRAIEVHRAELEKYLGIPRSEWFREDPDDFGTLPEVEYPGGEYTRTSVIPLPEGRSAHNEEACVFLDPVGRGCRLHRFALERDIDVHEIKPLVCLLFPMSFADGVLKPAYEFEVDVIVCQGPGPTLYSAAREDALYYFGPEMIAELDALAREYAVEPVDRNERTVSLPMTS